MENKDIICAITIISIILLILILICIIINSKKRENSEYYNGISKPMGSTEVWKTEWEMGDWSNKDKELFNGSIDRMRYVPGYFEPSHAGLTMWELDDLSNMNKPKNMYEMEMTNTAKNSYKKNKKEGYYQYPLNSPYIEAHIKGKLDHSQDGGYPNNRGDLYFPNY